MLKINVLKYTPVQIPHTSLINKCFWQTISPCLILRLIHLCVIVFLIGLITMILHPRKTSAAETIPFQTGEQLFYDIRWEFAAAGHAVFSVLPPVNDKDKDMKHFRLDVRTNSFVDMFYKIRERQESFTDINFSSSNFYRIHSTGTEKKEVNVTLDWEKGRASYVNFKEARPPVDIQYPCFDPLSAIFKMRSIHLDLNSRISFYVTDGKKFFLQSARVENQKTIKVPAGTFDTFLLIPELTHFGGVFKKSKNPKLKIWVTTDTNHIPVRIQSKVAIGSVIAELTQVKNN